MEMIGMEADQYSLYWEINRAIQYDELQSLNFDMEVLGGSYDSSSPEGNLDVPSLNSTVQNSILTERNRRKRLTDRLHALRGVVPNITKMNKESIVRDAINYIQELQEQERKMLEEISRLKSIKEDNLLIELEHDYENFTPRKKKCLERSSRSPSSSIELMELRVSKIGEKVMNVSITCKKKRDTMIMVCEIFESLNLKIITANIISVSGSLTHTLFVETNELMSTTQLENNIVAAIAQLNNAAWRNTINPFGH